MRTEPTRVKVAFPQGAYLRDYERTYAAIVSDELKQYANETAFALEDNPARADIIILIQSAQYKTVEYVRLLENDPLVRNHAERVYVIDYDDHPEGMLAGLYTSIERGFLDPAIHRIWPILFMNNPLLYDLDPSAIWGNSPTRLFSFVGAASHDVRNQLFNLFSGESPLYHVERVNKWYNYNDDEHRQFVKIALDSVFCLCPRGYASYTNRIPEVMAMGRVPVIIADDWVPFSFGEDRPYYIRVAERDMAHLPDILANHRKESEGYRRNARALWEQHCSRNRRVVAAVECVASLAARAGAGVSFEEYRQRWHSREFLVKCGWTFRQRLSLRLSQHARRLFGKPQLNTP
jgi:hypothetical protein